MRLFCLLSFIFFSACAVNTNADATKQSQGPKIFMAVLRATRIPSDTTAIKIVLEKQFWAEGKLKVTTTTDTRTVSNAWTCIFLNKQETTLKELMIPHPLMQDFEYYEEGGKLGRKAIRSETASFVIRTEINTDLYSIRIVDGNGNSIATIPINRE